MFDGFTADLALVFPTILAFVAVFLFYAVGLGRTIVISADVLHLLLTNSLSFGIL